MRFTAAQYDEAIANLQLAKNQLEPDGNNCAICSDNSHQAWECAWNPLRAMAAARRVYNHGTELHEALHALIGVYGMPINTPALAAIVPGADCFDPDQRFPLGSITRALIALDFNNALDRVEFKPNDQRLTEKLCNDYVSQIVEDPDMREGIAKDMATECVTSNLF